jgi:hypothetical protein
MIKDLGKYWCDAYPDLLYIHSKCCEGHWEICLRKDGHFELRCEVCGTPTGLTIMETMKNPRREKGEDKPEEVIGENGGKV